ncbi:rubrerythrin [Thermococcus eurythermalis]|uniref:Rubrerythrin n=2 Tax=Thermococcus eurythermalis TaxID=1505907 RepID=A0A097QW54_9EURY|nr:rubrerythrin [Thermococcus eurythermalis]
MEKDPSELMKEIVNRLKNLSAKELLSYAIFNEEEEAEYYAELAKRAERRSVKALFKKMSEESKGHEQLLRRLFNRLFPGEEPVKVDAPPVEVYPFYPKFESARDYLSALSYCMESELFAKHTYELLASVAQDEEVRRLALDLAAIEQLHYEEIKRVYDLIEAFERRHLSPRDLTSGAYLLTDDEKVKYFLLDFLDGPRVLLAFVRENPRKFAEFVQSPGKVLWVTKTDVEDGIPPELIFDMKREVSKFFKKCSSKGEQGVVFIQNLGYLASQLGFKEALDFVLYVKDLATLNNGYLVVTAIPEAFEKKEWAIITSELELIS